MFLALTGSTRSSGDLEAQTVDADGRVVHSFGPAELTQFDAVQWSTSRSVVAWVSPKGVMAARADGSDPRLLVPASTSCRSDCIQETFSLSPDGTEVLVAGAGPKTNRLVLASVRSGRAHAVAQALSHGHYVVRGGWSPDGAHIAYLRIDDASHAGPRLVVAAADGGQAHTVFSFAGSRESPSASWSPDSRRIAFVDNGDLTQDPAVATIDVATGAVQRISGLRAFLQIPAWSPDSRRLVLAQPGRPAVSVVVEGGETRSLGVRGASAWWGRGGLVVLSSDQRAVSFSADGRAKPRLLFRMAAGREILALDPR